MSLGLPSVSTSRNNTWLLMGFCCLFVISYVSAYLAIVRFKVPPWLRH